MSRPRLQTGVATRLLTSSLDCCSRNGREQYFGGADQDLAASVRSEEVAVALVFPLQERALVSEFARGARHNDCPGKQPVGFGGGENKGERVCRWRCVRDRV